ncbi:MAG: cytochrome c biogenesis protein CcsA [Deltaproteobacteria bacterium]|nr:cytochrome c biogenesis protein CcsA [Kofleriaceae bacterium]
MSPPDPDRLLSVTPSPAFWVAIVLYGVASIAFLVAFLQNKPGVLRAARAVLVGAFLAHGFDIGWRGVERVHPAASVREAIGFLAWIVSGGYLAASLRYRLDLAGAVLSPIVLGLLAAARLSPVGEQRHGLTLLGRVHISLATVGVAVFALASALAAIYLLEERNLKRKKFDALSFKNPDASLDALDALSQRLVQAGFLVFTVAVGLGIAWVAQRGDSMTRPEYPIAIITWMTYAALVSVRLGLGWRGRRTAWMALGGFGAALCVLAIYFLRRAFGG